MTICVTDKEWALPITGPGIAKLLALDSSFIGTPDYMGIAYFWHYEFRHYLRDSSRYRRRLVHKKLLESNLNPAGYSTAHAVIVKTYARPRS